LNYLADPGTRWAYHNGPYTLLDGVIENATGQTLNAYTAQKLKIPTGMTGSFFTVGYNNVFFSNARSMARFGSLILNKGNWNGNQIMADTAYFNDMVSTSQNLNKSYGYLWWLNGKTSYMLPTLQTVFNGTINPNAPADMIAAIGSGGQFLNVVPSQNLVWLRMGDEPSSTNVPFLLNDAIWEYVNELTCTTSDIEEQTMSRGIELFPNPTTGEIYLRSEIEMLNYELISLDGKLILSQDLFNQNEENIKLVEIEPGSYFLKVKTTEGLLVEKLIKK
jgi:CubicO group peptidase (beta-lactamase class C family)